MFSSRSISIGRQGWLKLSNSFMGLLAGLVVTLALFLLAWDHQRNHEQDVFDADTAKMIAGIRQSMTAADVLMHSAAGLLAAQPNATRDEWRLFVDAKSLRERFPGFQGIGFLKRIDVGPGPSVTDNVTWALPLTEPLSSGDLILGNERGGASVREAAMALARDLNTPQRTRMVKFSPGDGLPERLGFLIYRPVYTREERSETVPQRRRALTGFVVMPFSATALVSSLAPYEEAHRTFRIEIFDGRTTDAGARLFDSAEHNGYMPPRYPELVSEIVSQRFGSDWTFRLSSLPAYDSAHTSLLSISVLSVGVAASLVIFSLMSRLDERNKLALAAAHRDSDALRVELVHRVKNTLAVVQSIANYSLSGTGSVDEGREQFANRLSALARAHSLITENDWLGTEIGELIRSELAPLAHRATAQGPNVSLGPQVAQSLALVVHELAVEAVRRDVAALTVVWHVEATPEPTAVISWTEESGSRRAEPSLVRQIIRRGFMMETAEEIGPTSSRYTFRVPLL